MTIYCKKIFQDMEHFTFGNMNSEVCAMTQIQQIDYATFFKAFPSIKGFSIQGNSIALGVMDLPKLEILEIWTSTMKKNAFYDIANSKLPNLKKLNLLIGDIEEQYGCEVNSGNIEEFLKTSDFPNLVNLGICNLPASEFGKTLKAIFESKYAAQIKVLDISKSVCVDADGEYILANLYKLKNIKYIDLHYNYFTADILEKLKNCPIEINFSENQEIAYDEDDGEMYSSTMYAE